MKRVTESAEHCLDLEGQLKAGFSEQQRKSEEPTLKVELSRVLDKVLEDAPPDSHSHDTIVGSEHDVNTVPCPQKFEDE